ncbi:MAG: hypothetical protein WAN03_05320 [Candidatus Sulfotelmatobacter sp.]
MKFLAICSARLLSAALLLCVSCFAVDREAFTITNYDLNVRVEPEQHRLGARGKITLRNDSTAPQKIAVLQISSSLDWRSITVGGKAVQFLAQPYASDIDHTGSLSEAIVTLLQPVAPHATVDLDIAYEGVIPRDATRLTRIGAPEDAAQSSDWDRIDATFTAVRGAGYVAWYPIATESADLSDGNYLFEVLRRWNAREAGAKMEIAFENPQFLTDDPASLMLCSGKALQGITREGTAKIPFAKCAYPELGLSAPSFAIASYGVVDHPSITVYNLPSDAIAAGAYADAAEKVVPLITEWFGAPREKAQTADLPDPQSAPFESGSLLFTPLSNADSTLPGLSAAHQLTHATFHSPRPWINEGLAHFAQALYLEREKGRQAALDYMGLHRSALIRLEKPVTPASGVEPRPKDEAKNSLVNAANDELYRSKAMCVWWMLRDMIGDVALKKAIAAYRPENDSEPSYVQRLIAAQTQRDLEWFFDDWVYRDHGLPDFKIESVFPRKTLTNTFIVAVTVENLGGAGAEVPVIVKFPGGEIAKRLEVRAKQKATTRLETSVAPTEVVVNDGSVPESDLTNNVFKVEALAAQ